MVSSISKLSGLKKPTKSDNQVKQHKTTVLPAELKESLLSQLQNCANDQEKDTVITKAIHQILQSKFGDKVIFEPEFINMVSWIKSQLMNTTNPFDKIEKLLK